MQERGQIIIIFLILIAIGFYFLTIGLPDSNFGLNLNIKKPTLEKKTTISAPNEQKIDTKEIKSSSPESPFPDIIPPSRLNPMPSGDLPSETRKITMSLETDEKAICKYAILSGLAYDSMQHTFSESNSAAHSVSITTLSEGEEYEYYIKCADEKGNKNIDDFVISFKVEEPEDLIPPIRRNQYPVGDVLIASTTETIIGISTNERAICRYSTEQGIDYNSMRKSLSDDGTKKYHIAEITGLRSGKAYEYFVRCKDEAGNKNTGDVMISFSIDL